MGFFERFKKQKGLKLENIKNLEEGFFGSFDMYYAMYTDILDKGDYKKVDALVNSMYKIYDREERVGKVYDTERSYTEDSKILGYLDASLKYSLSGIALMRDILGMLLSNKEKLKEGKEIKREEVQAKLEEFAQRKATFKELEKIKNDCLQEIG